MKWQFPSVQNVLRLQKEQIEEFGGSHGLRDYGLLESAVSRARNKVEYLDDVTVPQVAASLSFGLIKNHAFIDGNKRIGLVVMNVFLKANGYQLQRTSAESAAMVKELAASHLSEEEWTLWVEQGACPIEAAQ